MMLSWLSGRRAPDDIAVRYDPALSRTIAIAVSSGLAVRRNNQAISLAPAGKDLARSVWSNSDVLREEKALLNTFPGKITQKSIRQLTEWR